MVEKFDKKKVYTTEEAIKLVKEASSAKFDETVEVAMNMNLDTRKADQQLRGAVVLPNGTGKSQTVLVLAKGDQAKAAKEAGADFVGDADMIDIEATDGILYGDGDSMFEIKNPEKDIRVRIKEK